MLIRSRSLKANGARRPEECPGRSGAAAVEMSLVAPLLFLLVLGIVDFGSLFFVRQTLVASAREGARELAIQGATLDEAIAVTNSRLTNSGITGATVTGENAYKGGGDDATARRVHIKIVLPVSNALLTGDTLKLFPDGATMSTTVTMRKEGELVPMP